MSARSLLLSCFAMFLLGLVGCAAKPQQVGFLSTYRNLEPVSETRLVYIGADIKKYDKFILDPIRTVYYDEVVETKVSPEDAEHLKQFFYQALYNELSTNYQIVATPGPRVARIRIAVTNLKASTPALNVLPQTKLTGLGLGQASAEMEIVDSVSRQQLAAAIESQTGSVVSLSGLTKWGDVQEVIKDWAKRIRTRVDEAHGKK